MYCIGNELPAFTLSRLFQLIKYYQFADVPIPILRMMHFLMENAKCEPTPFSHYKHPMNDFLSGIHWNLTSKDARPSTEQMQASIKPFQDWIDDGTNQGGEFLDDAIRMTDQQLERTGVNERE